MTVTDERNVKLVATSRKSYNESGLITFAVDVTSGAIESLLNGVSQFLGLFDTITVDFYWKHTYTVEFIGDLALDPQPALGADTTDLTGINDEQSVTVEVLNPGKNPLTLWHFTIDGDLASLKVESEEVDKIPDRIPWQLVFLPDGEAAGGDPVALGQTKIKMRDIWVPA